MRGRELKNHTIALMISTAIFIDVLQWLFAFIFMDWLVGFYAFLTFFVWFKLYGMKFMTPKRIATMGGAFIIEIIPVLSTLPAWTGAVVILILDSKVKKILPVGKQKDALAELNSKSNRTREENIRLVKARQIMERGSIDVNETDPALRAAYERARRGEKVYSGTYANRDGFRFNNIKQW